MHTLKSLAGLFVVHLSLGIVGCAGEIPTVAPSGLACDTVGEIRFVCNLISPEDLAVVPGSAWVIASGNRAGGRLHLVSVRDKTATTLFPGATSSEQLDAATYPMCPGPMDPDEGDAFNAHGLYLEPGPDAVHTLYVVHHGNRESIEVFEVDARAQPTLTWVGLTRLGGQHHQVRRVVRQVLDRSLERVAHGAHLVDLDAEVAKDSSLAAARLEELPALQGVAHRRELLPVVPVQVLVAGMNQRDLTLAEQGDRQRVGEGLPALGREP